MLHEGATDRERAPCYARSAFSSTRNTLYCCVLYCSFYSIFCCVVSGRESESRFFVISAGVIIVVIEIVTHLQLATRSLLFIFSLATSFPDTQKYLVHLRVKRTRVRSTMRPPHDMATNATARTILETFSRSLRLRPLPACSSDRIPIRTLTYLQGCDAHEKGDAQRSGYATDSLPKASLRDAILEPTISPNSGYSRNSGRVANLSGSVRLR
jgi:hypothetical protein